MKKRYVIGFVSGMEVSLPFFDSVVHAVVRDGCGIVSYTGGPVLHRLRNELARHWLARTEWADTEWMVMVDTDIIFTLEQLDALLAHDERVVSGIYASQIGEVVAHGCGFMLIHRSVFEELAPYPFNPIKTAEGLVSGEDIGFRVHCKERGIPVVVDSDIKVGHLKPQVMWVDAVAPEYKEVPISAEIMARP